MNQPSPSPVLFGPLIHEENRGLSDLGAREIATMLPLCLLVVWIGVQPNHFLDKTAGSLDRLSDRIEALRAADLEGEEVVSAEPPQSHGAATRSAPTPERTATSPQDH